ncbi:Enoyl-[acyl-carrier-protein] reductase [NADH] [hydrothermal vent metagenome]|uniref:Enoyl-[acyl-carrier-protein] reductase [NADH] n=1 Tax=hydrothermal vent metagenome TaxID=652676 RepID=A0A3B1BUM6_9ZZZZ
MSFLNFEGKNYVVFGVANKKSVAAHVAGIIRAEGGDVVFSVQDEDKKKAVEKLFPGATAYICDVSSKKAVEELAETIAVKHPVIHGLVHSIAFAKYSDGMKAFHEVNKNDFLEAIDISCFSLVTIAGAFKDIIDTKGAVVTISISSTTMAAENYGYMAPIKAALDSTFCFLAKSFSAFSEVRFNAVAPGLLKTSASAGIPGYVDSFLYAEKVIPRKRAVETSEAANVAAFLLSDASSGVNSQKVVVDAGMGFNYFDNDLISKALR